jgi:hypothetical protein
MDEKLINNSEVLDAVNDILAGQQAAVVALAILAAHSVIEECVIPVSPVANLPDNTTLAILRITGGPISFDTDGIVGEVIEAITTDAESINLKLQFDPDAGALGISDMCGYLNVKGDAIGELYSLTGTAITALANAPLGIFGLVGLTRGLRILQPGTIYMKTDATPTAGKIKWSLRYRPLVVGAKVEAI